MNNIPTTGELFAINQVSANTERCYKRQLHNFAEWTLNSMNMAPDHTRARFIANTDRERFTNLLQDNATRRFQWKPIELHDGSRIVVQTRG